MAMHDSRLALKAISVSGETAETADAALSSTVRRCLAASGSVTDKTDELLDYQVVLTNPFARITTLEARPLNIVSAVARFVWMVSYSNRLADIAFYEPKVRGYTDDGISVPGSNYGQRIFQPSPNTDQIVDGVVRRLKDDLQSRRAAVVIWQPADAVRESRDIPCAFGAFYHVRDDRLVATTIMRSNAAVRLLPFNIFEFSLLGEMVAREVGVEFGAYVHFAASMHVYDSEREVAKAIVAEADSGHRTSPTFMMPTMPASPFEQARSLCKLEAALRHDHAALAGAEPDALLSKARSELDPYWLAFYRVLLAHALGTTGRFDAADAVADQLPDYFRGAVLRGLQKQRPPAPTNDLQLSLDPRLDFGLTAIGRTFETAEEIGSRTSQFLQHAETVERRRGKAPSMGALRKLHQALVVDSIRLAAQSEGAGAPSDRNLLSLEEFEKALGEIERSTASS